MKEKTKQVFRSHLTATHIAYMSLFTALAFAVTFLEFPLFPGTPANFLKLDFANVFFLIEGFIFGPVEAVISILVKELLCLTKSSTGGVGELANFLMSSAYILIPSIAYRFKKGRGWVALYLLGACIMQVGASMLVNRYINFPVFGKFLEMDGAELFRSVWGFVLAFNAVKSVLISLIVLLIYKPLSGLIKATAKRFEKKRPKPVPKEPATEPAEPAEPASASVSEPAPQSAEPVSVGCPPPHDEGEG